MAHIQLVKQTSSGLLLPATPESCDFLHQIKIGEWIHADFKRVRNYAFHKRFFKLLQLGFDYWTPVGGAITPRERELLSGFVDYRKQRAALFTHSFTTWVLAISEHRRFFAK
ncbi:hypothetical protein BvCmsSINP043_00776 [Escherichia coli]|nr:hypothetical protein BvCmsSINP043_00776 [Escherichia coli]STN76384.1 phage protein [Escherichia coli]